MLKRYPLFLCCLLSFSGAHAQLQSAGSIPLTRQDSAQAVHELFKSRRGGGFGWLAFGGAGMAASILPAQQTTSAGVWTPGVVIGSALAALGTKKLIQFGWGRERRVLRHYAATGQLPADIRHRLRGDFRPLPGPQTWPLALALPALPPAPSASAPVVDAPIPGSSTTGSPAASLPASDSAARATAQLRAAYLTRQDTLDAVVGLFNAKRFGGSLPLVLALPGLRLMTGATKTNSAPGPYGQAQANSDPPAGQVAAGLLLGLGGVVYMFVHNAPYTNAKLKIVCDNFLLGQPLPAHLRDQLKPKHFSSGRAYREKMERRAARH